jgi:hypothetical protein
LQAHLKAAHTNTTPKLLKELAKRGFLQTLTKKLVLS